jgi:hypothetical protein
VPDAATSLRLLVVEDEPLDAELAALELRRAGFAPTWKLAHRLEDVQRALDDALDVVICDYTLPQLDGLDVVRLVGERRPGLPVIVVSGTFGEEAAVEAMRAGAADFLTKNQLSRLPRAVHQALAHRRLVSEKRAAEEALRLQNVELRSIIESAVCGIVRVDAEGRIRVFNPEAERMFGVPRAQALGGDLASFLPQGLRTGPGFARRADRSDFPVEIFVSHTDETGAFTLVVRDDTERRRAEAEREEALRRLANAERLESLGLLAGGIAHDFNNLLTSMLANAEFALEQLGPESGAREAIRQVGRAAERAAALTRQLLTYAGRGRPERHALDLSPYVRDVAELLGAGVSKKVRFELELGSALAPVEADPALIQQLVMNLLMNAAEAYGERAGTVRVATRRRRVAAGAPPGVGGASPPPGEYVELVVEDEGCGMPDETLARIFDPFFSTKPQGRGLGLSALLGTVNSHGGALYVRSQAGAGSRFTVLLPAAGRHAAAEARERGELPMGEGTILAVDDEPAILALVKRVLESFGYRVLTVGGGSEAVEWLRARPDSIDVAIVDLSMPELAGDEVLALLRGIRPDLPVLLSTGWSDPGLEARLVAKGFTGVLSKPYSVRALVTSVTNAIRAVKRDSS